MINVIKRDGKEYELTQAEMWDAHDAVRHDVWQGECGHSGRNSFKLPGDVRADSDDWGNPFLKSWKFGGNYVV